MLSKTNKVSIVLAIYNGEKYILQQLESIYNQTEVADEVLIFDDCSTDKSLFVVKEFIKSHNCFNWKIEVNHQNKGWKRNFIEGISKASGEIVFLADQDDIWHEKKIEMMLNVFANEPEANLVICDHLKFFNDSEISPCLIETLKPCYKKNRLSDWRISRPGCTYAFRKSFFELIRDAWFQQLPHDCLLYVAGWLSDSVFYCPNKLHYFRRHQDSVTTKSPILIDEKRRMENIQNYIDAINRIVTCDKSMSSKRSYNVVKFLQLRKRAVESKRIVDCLNLFFYLKYYNSLKTFLADCYVSLK